MTRVSFIMATYNRAEQLRKTLSNIKEYITDEDELIIVDGGSTDQTCQVIQENKKITAHFHFISEPDYGEAHALNKGMLIAQGEIIKFLSDDDYFYPSAMHSAISIMESSPHLDAILCGGEQYELDKDGEHLLRYWRLPPDRQFTDDINNNLENLRLIGGGLALLFRKRIIPIVGLLNRSVISTDVDFNIRIIKQGVTIKYYDVNLYHYVVYPHSNSRNIGVNALSYIALFNGAWDLFMRNNSEVITNLLGLNNVNKGRVLAQIIIDSDKLRNSHYPFLHLVLILVKLLRKSQLLLQKIVSLTQIKDVSTPLENPIWTNELR